MWKWKHRKLAVLAAVIALGLTTGACAASSVYVGVSAPGPWYGAPVPYGGGVMIGRPVW